MIRPTSVKSSACRPRVASAGVPTRRPLVTIGGRGSNGTALRLTVMPMSCRRSSACWPSSSDSRRSTSTRCTSVPPVSTLTPWPAPSSSSATRLGARDGAALALAERLGRGDLERDRLAGDHVLERAALLAREDGRVDLLGVLLAAEDHAAARAAERLVDRGGDDVGVRHRARVHAGGDEARRSAPCRPSAARRPRRRSRGSARSPGSAGRPTSRRGSASGGAPWRSARPRPCRSGSSRGRPRRARCRTAGPRR